MAEQCTQLGTCSNQDDEDALRHLPRIVWGVTTGISAHAIP
jgi:hypothetical protein